MKQKLTKRAIDSLQPSHERYEVFDSELPGFLVRIAPDGEKTFAVRYRVGPEHGARRRRLTLGRYGVITAEQARTIARQRLADVVRGEDPAGNRRAVKIAPTVEGLGDEFLLDVDARRKLRTAVEYRRLWSKHIQPAIGRQLVATVSHSEISKLHRGLRETPTLANRVLALLGSFFSYAERQGVRTRRTNPAHDVQPYAEKARERFLTPAEVGRLGDALNRAEKEGLPPASTFLRKTRGISRKRRARMTGLSRGPYKTAAPRKCYPANPYAVAAIRFLLLTGWREQEALTLQWSFLTEDFRTATLPDSKTGRSVRKLGAPARELLSRLPRVEGSLFAFPSSNPSKPLNNIERTWHAAREAAALTDVRLHDLRHSYASSIASGGGSLLVIAKLLGHKQVNTTARYAHLLDDPLQAAADSASSQLATWLASPPPTPITGSRP
jgi:integrase